MLLSSSIFLYLSIAYLISRKLKSISLILISLFKSLVSILLKSLIILLISLLLTIDKSIFSGSIPNSKYSVILFRTFSDSISLRIGFRSFTFQRLSLVIGISSFINQAALFMLSSFTSRLASSILIFTCSNNSLGISLLALLMPFKKLSFWLAT